MLFLLAKFLSLIHLSNLSLLDFYIKINLIYQTIDDKVNVDRWEARANGNDMLRNRE